MSRSRTWNLRLNLDSFNAAFAALADDPERSQFLAGLSRGMNGGMTRDGLSFPFQEGFLLGSEMRDEAEALRQANTINGLKGGSPSHKGRIESPPGAPIGEGGMNRSGTLSLNPLIPETNNQNPQIREPIPPPSKSAGRRKSTSRSEGGSLEEILGGGKGTVNFEAYWRLAGTFGVAKNPAPKTSARLYVEAIGKGATVERIQNRAENLRRANSDEKYMPQLAKWLEGEGYLAPDAPLGGKASRLLEPSPMVREYMEQNRAFFGGVEDVPA